MRLFKKTGRNAQLKQKYAIKKGRNIIYMFYECQTHSEKVLMDTLFHLEPAGS